MPPEFRLVKTAKVRKNSRKNSPKLLDSFEFVPDVDIVNPDLITQLYSKEMQSAKQIAIRFGVSKTKVLDLLHEYKVTPISNAQRREQNYRFSNPPYGYKVEQGTLVPCSKEIKIIRKILKLREQETLSWEKIAVCLNEQGHRTRCGGKWWSWPLIPRLYKQWNGKL